MAVHARDREGIYVTGLRIRTVKQVLVQDICHPQCGLTAAYEVPAARW